MQYPIIKYLQEQIAVRTLDNSTDTLWANILPLYFPVTEGYGTAAQRQGAPGAPKTKLWHTIRRVIRDGKTVLCVVSDHRADLEDTHSAWPESVETLTERLKAHFATNGDALPIFGVAAVGHNCQFWKLENGEEKLEDLTGGRFLHMLHDENEIVEMILAVVNVTE
jgi:hypothetical protein